MTATDDRRRGRVAASEDEERGELAAGWEGSEEGSN